MTLHANRLRNYLFTVTLFLLLMQLAAISALAQYGVTTCGSISEPGHYTLQNDLNCTVTDGIDILVPDVELNLNGHTITGGSNNIGIDISASRARVLGPGTINGFSVGLVAQFTTQDVEVTGVTSTGASGVGFVARFAKVKWKGNTASGSAGQGFELLPGNDSDLSGNHATGNAAEGFLISGNHNHLMLNTALNNGTVGISVTGSHNEMISNSALGNTNFDLSDGDPNCGDNRWVHNVFSTANETCIH
jgi:hypothetical protein